LVSYHIATQWHEPEDCNLYQVLIWSASWMLDSVAPITKATVQPATYNHLIN
jgi:hypothetical protein